MPRRFMADKLMYDSVEMHRRVRKPHYGHELRASPGSISDMNLVQVCRWASTYPPYKCILEYGKSIPINV